MGRIPDRLTIFDHERLRRFVADAGSAFDFAREIAVATDVDSGEIMIELGNLTGCLPADRSPRVMEIEEPFLVLG